MQPQQGEDPDSRGEPIGNSIPDLMPTLSADAIEQPVDDSHSAFSVNIGVGAIRSPLRRIGGYEIISEIGRGGMGVVYKARQLELNRIVALKTIRGFVDGESISRFKREAEALARLSHENIVPVFDFFEEAHNYYLSLGFVEGSDLQSTLKAGPLNGREACRILVQISNAIEYAHQQGVIHRDLKPSNVLIDKSGTCRVADFGLAKLVAGREDLTRDGQVLGTPAYMSPEQASGNNEKTSVASDVYSLGAILYRCVAGRPPFSGRDVKDVLVKVCREDAKPPSQFVDSVDRDIDTICLKCLEKESGARYRSASELVQELTRYLSGEPILSRPISAFSQFLRTCSRWPAETALAVATAIVVCLGTALLSTWLIRVETSGKFNGVGLISGSQVLVMLSAFGPVFSACRAIGPLRLRKVEEAILISGCAVLKLLVINTVFVLQLMILYSVTYLLSALGQANSGIAFAFCLSVQFGVMLLMQWTMNWKRMFFWTICLSASLTLGLVVLGSSPEILKLFESMEPASYLLHVVNGLLLIVSLLCIPFAVLFLWFSIMTQTHFGARLIHTLLRALQNGYSQTVGFVPFPLSKYPKEYDMRTAYLVLGVMPFALVMSALLVILFAIGTSLFFPFWLAEQLRSILTPQKPIFTDLIAYGVSIITLIILALRFYG